jgi:hypothetical protein
MLFRANMLNLEKITNIKNNDYKYLINISKSVKIPHTFSTQQQKFAQKPFSKFVQLI